MVVALPETIYQVTVITTDFTYHTCLQTNLSTVAIIQSRLSETAIICCRPLMFLFLLTMNNHFLQLEGVIALFRKISDTCSHMKTIVAICYHIMETAHYRKMVIILPNQITTWLIRDNINIEQVTYLHNQVNQIHFLGHPYLSLADNNPVRWAVMHPRAKVIWRWMGISRFGFSCWLITY